MFICAGKTENFNFAKSVGIGLIESAINLSKICSYDFIDSLIFIGTAGSYDTQNKILDIYISTQSTQIEASYTNQQSYTPIDNQIQSEPKNVPCETKNLIVNSSNYIHTNTDFSKKMLTAGIMLENMEFFSVMKTAQSFNIECYGIFCITNYCNPNAHQDFLTNHQKAKEKLESFVRKNYIL
ncbi:purine-nucleoside phosphorylase [Helicobacter sp. 13S00477-4]|uniref:phosphorylase family protein n=1 Tax=Helicobacter sp. 13S00477-4 TaxID=1905759 RepID=UPI000BA58A18|nr:purine-nucleoside phosphorylase [Helicobacter sp. 13S00477-4]PAF52435.1 purine-nucleoside phosphorylase [Helicobacter sp. 13S00477-4]